MSESERYEAQGRAHAALKEARSNLATLQTVIKAYIDQLSGTAALGRQFLSDPHHKSATFVPIAEELKRQAQAVEQASGGLGKLVDELLEQAARIRELEEQVAKF